MSKYRADCYGIEFAVQKRGADTTDSSGDKDVFFVKCIKSKENLLPDRTIPVVGARSDAVFNGAFTPMACVRANAGMVCLQDPAITLRFASSTGNSSIVIGTDAMNGDISLEGDMATCATVEFTTGDVEMLDNFNGLVEIEDQGILYRGYVQEVDTIYGRVEAAKYKLIVKEIEL